MFLLPFDLHRRLIHKLLVKRPSSVCWVGKVGIPESALVLVDGGEAVAVHGVEVVLVGDARGNDLRVHHVTLARRTVLKQRLDGARERKVSALATHLRGCVSILRRRVKSCSPTQWRLPTPTSLCRDLDFVLLCKPDIQTRTWEDNGGWCHFRNRRTGAL